MASLCVSAISLQEVLRLGSSDVIQEFEELLRLLAGGPSEAVSRSLAGARSSDSDLAGHLEIIGPAGASVSDAGEEVLTIFTMGRSWLSLRTIGGVPGLLVVVW